MEWCQRKYDTYLGVLIQRLAKPLFVFSHVAFPSLDYFSRRYNRLGTFRLQQILYPYSLATFVVAVIRSVQSSPRFKSIVDFGVLHCYQCSSFGQQCQGQVQLSIMLLKTLLLDHCGCDLWHLTSQPSAVLLIDLGFAGAMCAVKWNDHSGQSPYSLVNVGALPMVLVSTRGTVTFGTAAICCRVSIRALSVCTRRVISAYISDLT